MNVMSAFVEVSSSLSKSVARSQEFDGVYCEDEASLSYSNSKYTLHIVSFDASLGLYVLVKPQPISFVKGGFRFLHSFSINNFPSLSYSFKTPLVMKIADFTLVLMTTIV